MVLWLKRLLIDYLFKIAFSRLTRFDLQNHNYMFIKIILRWIALSCAVWVTSQIIPGIVVNPFWVAFIVGAFLTLFNMFIKPVINILTLPINIVTLGLFSLVVNGLLFWYLGNIINGFNVTTFSAAFVGAILVSVINWILKKVFHFDF